MRQMYDVHGSLAVLVGETAPHTFWPGRSPAEAALDSRQGREEDESFAVPEVRDAPTGRAEEPEGWTTAALLAAELWSARAASRRARSKASVIEPANE